MDGYLFAKCSFFYEIDSLILCVVFTRKSFAFWCPSAKSFFRGSIMDKKLKGKFLIEVFNSKKGNKCLCLKVDLGYARKALTFDSSLIAEMLGVSVVDVMALDFGTYYV